jgi:hypothetical protein
MILFMERIRLKGDFFVENSSDFFPCLSASCGILTSFWVRCREPSKKREKEPGFLLDSRHSEKYTKNTLFFRY